MTETAGVFNNHRDVTKIRALPYRRFNADFHSDANDGKSIDAAIAQRDVQWRAFKRGHCDLVEYRLAGQWVHLGNQMETRRVPQEPRLDLINRFHPLPSHSHAHLRYPHESLGQ